MRNSSHCDSVHSSGHSPCNHWTNASSVHPSGIAGVEASSSGSVLLGNSTVNRNAELLSGQGYSTAYPAHLVEHWASSLPENPEVALNECKWDVTNSCTQYDIADQVCDGHASSLCAFDIPSSDMQEDFPTDVCFLARKL